MRSRWGAIIGAALASLLLLQACSAPGVPAPGASSVATSASASASAFVGSTLDGASFDSASVRGKPVVLWFWAPWCTICRIESATITAVEEEFRGEVTMIGVAGRGTVDEMKRFVSETDTGRLLHLSDTSGAIWQQFGIVAQPAYVFMSPDGTVQTVVGALGGKELRKRMTELQG
ncbi:MAG: redoxin domain-containing protein [Micropruina sp.]